MENDSTHSSVSFIYIAEPHYAKSSFSISVLGPLHPDNDGTEQGEGSDKIAWLYNLSAPVKWLCAILFVPVGTSPIC